MKQTSSEWVHVGKKVDPLDAPNIVRVDDSSVIHNVLSKQPERFGSWVVRPEEIDYMDMAEGQASTPVMAI